MAGVAAPTLAMLMLVDAPAPAPLALVGGPILAVGLMGVGMIGAAAAGRLWIGVLLAVLTGAGLIVLARALGMPTLPHPFSTGLAVIIASFSFAARGALFARSAGDRGWWIAVFVVAGEAAMLLTASALPGALPDWLLVLLPAQWASTAIQTALTGTGTRAASSALLALAGTAAATLLVARLWPRRWPYLVMFTTWLGLSALVWHRPGPPMPRADLAIVAAPAGPIAPIAFAPPDAATASALARIRRQLEKWPAAGEADVTQRARNLLLIAAVADLYDTEPLQSHLPLLVAAELKARLPADQRAAILAGIAADPAAGSVAARETLAELGLPANVGDETPVRNRMGLYAARLAGR
ncbi:hypothetical protein F3168_02035 [Polymorphobacter fuscus]|uniref:Uncharacterized protein n=1 Tax=Sandarakinorhabdus fusca TaxID=1439888 RepID=A0A7C9KGX9_9SPHN|nr:hypothetical protein F9290_02035 [Polymorphobacter fuscus]MQT16041.1 hypothetical protein [Polymorphobacter fuscus]